MLYCKILLLPLRWDTVMLGTGVCYLLCVTHTLWPM